MKKLLLLLLAMPAAAAVNASGPDYGTSARPEVSERLFTSQAVERQIERIRQTVTVSKLVRMFENCFPNTLDTTVHYRKDEDGEDDTFIYTAIFTPCGCVIQGRRCGPTSRWRAKTKPCAA